MEDAVTSLGFDFEELDAELPLLPLAARRALDVAGLTLSLEGWQSLPLAERRELARAGCEATVSLSAVERVASNARPAPVRVQPRPDPTEIEPELAAAVGERQGELASAWASLTPLERYALTKLAHGKRRTPAERQARLERACGEILPRRATLTHLTPDGDAHMVDVSLKPATARRAVASGFVRMQPATLEALRRGDTPKGDVLAVARIAGIQAAKRTPELIPLCHAVALTGVEVTLEPRNDPPGVALTATARAFDRTGVEMEALVAVSTAALALYDMLKAIDRGMTITDVALVAKSGGRSGDFRREHTP